MSSSLIGRPIHSALCHIKAKRFVNYISIQTFSLGPHSFGFVPHQSKALCKLHKRLGTSGNGYRLADLTSEFESHWAPHSFGLVPHRSKALCKLHKYPDFLIGRPIHSALCHIKAKRFVNYISIQTGHLWWCNG